MEPIQGKAIGLSLIANYLGLNTEATENSILTEVQARINTEILNRNKAEDEVAKFKKELDKMKADADEASDKFKKMEDTYNALVAKNAADATDVANKIKAAEDAAKAVEAKNMVEGFVKVGKIKAEAVAKWVPLAVADFDGIKNMLEELPINKVGHKIEGIVTDKVGTGYNAASRMLEIANRNKK